MDISNKQRDIQEIIQKLAELTDHDLRTIQIVADALYLRQAMDKDTATT